MRQTIKGLLAAFAVMTAGAAPAMACGYSPCASYAPIYGYAPAYSYTYTSGCGVCGNFWAYDRLAEPTTQYYYVNQGPTYSGPGAFAPAPAYEEDALPVYGYGWRHSYRPYYHGYRYGWRHYGYARHRYAYRHRAREGWYYGHRLVRRYY